MKKKNLCEQINTKCKNVIKNANNSCFLECNTL